MYCKIELFIETGCDTGLFGQDCKEKCGKCVKGDNCHHVNGTCLNGCDPGYQGLNCTEGNQQTDMYALPWMNKYCIINENHFLPDYQCVPSIIHF